MVKLTYVPIVWGWLGVNLVYANKHTEYSVGVLVCVKGSLFI